MIKKKIIKSILFKFSLEVINIANNFNQFSLRLNKSLLFYQKLFY